MKNDHTDNNLIEKGQRQLPTCYGMYPGGGFVAWPDGRTTETPQKEESHFSNLCRGHQQKGFVARPEKE